MAHGPFTQGTKGVGFGRQPSEGRKESEDRCRLPRVLSWSCSYERQEGGLVYALPAPRFDLVAPKEVWYDLGNPAL